MYDMTVLRLSVFVFVFACLHGVAVPGLAVALPWPPAPTKSRLILLHTNDMHSRYEQTDVHSGKCTERLAQAKQCYGGFARLAHVIRRARAGADRGETSPVLFLNAGDTFQGTVWYTVHKWRIAAAFINILSPDAISLGNHEFDDGVAGLVPFINNVTCPVLAANVDAGRAPALLDSRLRKSVVLSVNNVSIGVVGYLTPDTKNLSRTGPVEISDEVEALKREIAVLKRRNISIFIAVGHSGFDVDKRIARDVPDVDVVIGGHTNTFLYNGTAPNSEVPAGLYPTVIKQASGRLVPVVQAYAYTKYLGNLTMEFDENGEATSFFGNPILLDMTIPEDSDVLSELDKWRKEMTAKLKEVVGESQVFLQGGVACRFNECNLGNLITDAMVYYRSRNHEGPEWTDVAIAVINGGGIRNSISPVNGDITLEDVMDTLPFNNTVDTLTVMGSQILEMLEWSVFAYDIEQKINKGGFLQMSGLKVIYDLTKDPGHRVHSASARCADCSNQQYSPIEPHKQYKMLVPVYLTEGGDGYYMFGNVTTTQGDIDIDVVLQYLKDKRPVNTTVEGRIIFEPSIEDLQKTIPGAASTITPAVITVTLISFLISFQ